MRDAFPLGLAAAALVAAGCNDNELGIQKKHPNSVPQTVHSSGPVDSTAGTTYRAHLYWWGSDPDGTVDHYDIILVDHDAALDSIRGDDRNRVHVTIPDVDDPRWTATHARDSVFVTRADVLRRDPWPGPTEPPEQVRRRAFERWHTFFVRAVDNEGLPDPTPDYRSFNSRSIAPTIELQAPVRSGQILPTAPVTVFNWKGTDPDGGTEDPTEGHPVPVASRWVLISSQRTLSGLFISYPDSLYHLPARFHWSPWHAWRARDKSGTQAVLRALHRRDEAPQAGYYIFAVQAIDEAGAVTPVLDYKTPGKNNVALFTVSGIEGPRVTVDDRYLGHFSFVKGSPLVSLDIAAGQPVEFSWSGDASAYGGVVTDYRWCWDVHDLTNDSEWDQGWSTVARHSRLRTFSTGAHRFFLEAKDNVETITRASFQVVVRPVTRARDVLLVDDTLRFSPLDELYEDRRWNDVLTDLALKHGFRFDPVADVYDVVNERRNQPPPIELLFDYKAVVWSVVGGSSAATALRRVALFLDPFVDRTRSVAVPYNFLNIYLDNGGKIWLSGFRPAYNVWTTEAKMPVNVTNWDDPIQHHPAGIDSVGTRSWLYKMGIQAYDVGSGGAAVAVRGDLSHGCRGLRRAAPPGYETQTFLSSSALGHTHRFVLQSSDVDLAPAEGSRYVTGSPEPTTEAHTHTVVLTADDLLRLGRGETVSVETSESPLPSPHVHRFEIMDQVGLWGIPPLVVDYGRWSQGNTPGRQNIELYNMPQFMANQEPPLSDGRTLALYTFVSGHPADPSHGYFYPQTADGQPVVILTKNLPSDPDYTRAWCGFEPVLLKLESHERLAELLLVRHFHIGTPASN